MRADTLAWKQGASRHYVESGQLASISAGSPPPSSSPEAWQLLRHTKKSQLISFIHANEQCPLRCLPDCRGHLFILAGAYLAVVVALGALSFWYVLCFCALPMGGVLWAWRPRIAAALSLGPLIAVAALLPYLSGVWLASGITGLATALLCVIITAKNDQSVRVALAISLSFSVCILSYRPALHE